MKDILDHATLKTKQRAIRSSFPKTMGLRAHRSISWIGRAEVSGDDHDARFFHGCRVSCAHLFCLKKLPGERNVG